jgi:uncharacterized Rossmann fold enzyme
MLNVCCVCVGTAYDPSYVEILFSMVRRNLAAGTRGRFVVFTDNPAAFSEMAGVETRHIPDAPHSWWAKLWLFKPDAFPKGERVLYFDLDTLITGPLDEIARYDGQIAILRDVYRPDGLQSSVMAWEAGTLEFVWQRWLKEGMPLLPGGDQEWLERMYLAADLWQELFPGRFRSYKLDCTEFVPKGTSVVFFHGHPRPHEVKDGWVPDVWKVSNETMFFSLNVKEEQLRANVTYALTKPKWVEMRDGTQYPAIIVGGGPSLKDDLWRIRGYQLSGAVIYATNNTWRFLKEAGITPDAHVMHDAREGNLPFVPSEGLCYYASQCHPSVLDAAGDRLLCWHPHSEVVLDTIGANPKGSVMVSGGSTIGLNAVSLAYILGHRKFLLFGFDSSYADGQHHAYSQTLNDGELVLEARVGEEVFHASPWMIQQSEQFIGLARQLIGLGCEVSVYGYGLLPTLVANLEPTRTPADERAESVLQWLRGVPNPVGAEIGVFAGEMSQKLLSRPDVTLYLVDSWTANHDPRYAASGDFHAGLTQREQDHFCEAARRIVSFAGPRAKIIRKPSMEAARDIPDGSLDFVFIDADHSYEGCKADIEAWLPKVRKGGFISGHDYENTDFPKFGVTQAVTEKFGAVELGANFTWHRRIE